MQDLVLSFVFLCCQLLLLGFVFGLVFLPKPHSAKPIRISISAKMVLMGVTTLIVITTALIHILSFQFRGAEASRAASTSAGAADADQLGISVTAEAWKGRPMIVRFEEDACLKFEFGTISCETDYVALYDASRNRWTVTGYSSLEKKVITATTTNGDRRPGSLSIWGALSEFNDSGLVRRFEEVVGEIRIQSEQEQNVTKSDE
jgi:hypothetical protein